MPNSAKLVRLVKLRKFLPVFDSVFIYFSIKKMVLTDCLSLQFAIAYKQFVRTKKTDSVLIPSFLTFIDMEVIEHVMMFYSSSLSK